MCGNNRVDAARRLCKDCETQFGSEMRLLLQLQPPGFMETSKLLFGSGSLNSRRIKSTNMLSPSLWKTLSALTSLGGFGGSQVVNNGETSLAISDLVSSDFTGYAGYISSHQYCNFMVSFLMSLIVPEANSVGRFIDQRSFALWTLHLMRHVRCHVISPRGIRNRN